MSTGIGRFEQVYAEHVVGIYRFVYARVGNRPDAEDLTAQYPQLVDDPYELPDRVPAEVVKILYAGLDRDPAARPLPHEVADALEPVLARQPAVRLGGFKVT